MEASSAHAGMFGEWQVPGAQFDVPATFSFGIEGSGLDVGLEITLTESVETIIDWHITAENAAVYGVDWDTLRQIAGGQQAGSYHAWIMSNVEIGNAPFDPVPAGRKDVFAAGANSPLYFPNELRLTFASSPANTDLFVRMIVDDARQVPEPTTLVLLLALPIALIRRRSS